MERNAECCLSGWKWREEVGNMVEAAEKTMRRAGEMASARGGSQGTREGSEGGKTPGVGTDEEEVGGGYVPHKSAAEQR